MPPTEPLHLAVQELMQAFAANKIQLDPLTEDDFNPVNQKIGEPSTSTAHE